MYSFDNRYHLRLIVIKYLRHAFDLTLSWVTCRKIPTLMFCFRNNKQLPKKNLGRVYYISIMNSTNVLRAHTSFVLNYSCFTGISKFFFLLEQPYKQI